MIICVIIYKYINKATKINSLYTLYCGVHLLLNLHDTSVCIFIKEYEGSQSYLLSNVFKSVRNQICYFKKKHTGNIFEN